MVNVLSHRHPFHLVDPSPWPLISSFSAFTMVTGVVLWFHSYLDGFALLCIGLFLVSLSSYGWWRDVTREATFEGQHTEFVQNGIKWGFFLFLASEVMLFFGIFWAFFHSSLAPMPDVGGVWPPVGISPLSAWEIPLLNTIILLTSGACVTFSHHAVLCGDRRNAIYGLILTIGLAVIFTLLQAYEYYESPFTFSDSVFGACFFMGTGFHGAHVLAGTGFLFLMTLRLIQHQLTAQHHFGLEAAILYWHLVDVVWLFLFVVVYWWGGA